MFLTSLLNAGCDQRICLRATRGRGTDYEAHFEKEAAISIERQSAPFARRRLCSFCHALENCMASRGAVEINRPPYSPDFAPIILLFPEVKPPSQKVPGLSGHQGERNGRINADLSMPWMTILVFSKM